MAGPGPLSGIRVVDTSAVLAMPITTHILADMGAEVIKVESHKVARTAMGVLADNEPGEEPWNRESSFNGFQRSKLGVTIDFKTPEGVELMKELVGVSDVIVESNRPGVMDRLGLGYNDLQAVRGDLIYLSNTGFGHTGPWRTYAGIGSMFELTCGLSQVTGYVGDAPRRAGASWFDLHVAWMGVFAILAALHHRQKTGNGQWIDFAMYQIGVATVGDLVLDFASNGRNGTPQGNEHPYMAPHNVYPCSGEDSWITIAVETDRQWEHLCRVLDVPPDDDPRFADQLSRWHNRRELDSLIAVKTRQEDAAVLVERLQVAGVHAGRVLNAREVLTDPGYRARGFFERIEHAPESGLGARDYIARPWRMSKSTACIRRPAPRLGEHNELIFGDLLGHSADEIARLYQLEVLGRVPVGKQRIKPAPSPQRELEEGSLAAHDPNYKTILGY